MQSIQDMRYALRNVNVSKFSREIGIPHQTTRRFLAGLPIRQKYLEKIIEAFVQK